MSTLDRVLTLIRDDSYAASFQSLGQYRAALLQAARGEVPETAVKGRLPCPFCGAEPELVTFEEGENAGGNAIVCPGCLACSRVVFGEKEGLMEAWNRRAVPAVQGLVDALEDIAGTHHQSASGGGYFAKVARTALAAHRKQGGAA